MGKRTRLPVLSHICNRLHGQASTLAHGTRVLKPLHTDNHPNPHIPSRCFHAASWVSNGFPPAAPALWYRLTTFLAPRAL